MADDNLHQLASVPDQKCVPNSKSPNDINDDWEKGLSTDEQKGGVSGVPTEGWELVSPIPKNAPPVPQYFKKLGAPTQTYVYENSAGILCYVLRFDQSFGKEFRPLTLWQKKQTGEMGWCLKALPEPRPLYNLHLLERNPEARVIICEGEKAVNAAMKLFPEPDFVCVTAMNGCMSVKKADWQPLRSRDVILWPDNDEPGIVGMLKVREILTEINAASVNTICHNAFEILPDGSARHLPKGWDAVDAVEENYTASLLQEIISDPRNLVSSTSTSSAKTGYALHRGEKGLEDGVYFHGHRDPPVRVCAPLLVKAIVRSPLQDSWGALLEWHDLDGHMHRFVAPGTMAVGDGAELCRILCDQGLDINIATKFQEHIRKYVFGSKPKTKARCTERTGWRGKAFVLPHKTLGTTEEEIYFSMAAARHAY